MSKETITTASVLAFERKLSNSDALMYCGNWEDRDDESKWAAIDIREKSVRGTISNRQSSKIEQDSAKLDAAIQNANLQTVDIASLPIDKNTLKVKFTLRVLGDLASPTACNNKSYQDVLKKNIENYINKYQFEELASRYAENLANGRFLWRNRFGAEAIEVKIMAIQSDQIQKKWVFNSLDFNVRTFGNSSELQLAELTKSIQNGLMGEINPLLVVEAYVKLGSGQEVFPSQELVLDKNINKSKILYQVSSVAAMHSQKIGNAIRTIDTWYSELSEVGPIPVEPYGSVTNQGTAYRQPNEKIDFYSLFDAWMTKGVEPDEHQQHYVIANLIRGGVFGKSEKAK